jgi:predicted nucleic acid-binding protein
MIDLSRKQKYALDLVASYQEKEQIATTIITQYEMLRGAPEPFLPYITNLLNRFIILEFSNDALVEAVKIYKNLKEEGALINELDIIIAAIAVASNETLITKDTDFLNLKNNKITVLTSH